MWERRQRGESPGSAIIAPNSPFPAWGTVDFARSSRHLQRIIWTSSGSRSTPSTHAVLAGSMLPAKQKRFARIARFIPGSIVSCSLCTQSFLNCFVRQKNHLAQRSRPRIPRKHNEPYRQQTKSCCYRTYRSCANPARSGFGQGPEPDLHAVIAVLTRRHGHHPHNRARR
jgi:hypothetical protein